MSAIDLKGMSVPDLNRLLSSVSAELMRRWGVGEDHEGPVYYTMSLYGGNARAGAKVWAKELTGIDPSQPNGFGLEGPWAPRSGAQQPGRYMVAGGKGGSWKNASSSYVLLRVKRGAEFQFSNRYQEFSGTGLELVASSVDKLDEQAVIDVHPDLAPSAGGKLFPIYAALRSMGY